MADVDHSNSLARTQALAGKVVVSVDAMGGDRGPEAVIAGLSKSAAQNQDIAFLVHGPATTLDPLITKQQLQGRCEVVDVEGVVTMDAKPAWVMRNGRGTSMYSTLNAVAEGQANVAVSCGNTGALMALSMLKLRKLEGVNRPAIACLWPSKNPQGNNVLLDVGADIRADSEDLVQFALMGVSYARAGLDIARPRVGVLNVGTEENKGHPELKRAHDLIAALADASDFEFVGYVEGGDIPSNTADVIVTDGFTGNIALKTAEGTARLIRGFLHDAFQYSFLSRIAALMAYTSFGRLSARIDPRRVNGGVFLGLNGTVVKSHGAADATSVSAAVKLAYVLAERGFDRRLKARLATAAATGQDAPAEQ